MIALAEAQARLIALAVPVSSENVPLALANGRWLAADVIAKRTRPARDLSAMDGYALRALTGRSQWRVVGESAAGSPFSGAIGTDEAVRISTGAALPDGADTILIQENTTRTGDALVQSAGVPPLCGQHVRALGSDFSAGTVLISAGSRLNPAKIALAAMAGHGALPVCRRVKVAMLSTGNELVAPGSATDDDHIPATNALMVMAMLDGWPVEMIDGGIIADDLDTLTAAIAACRDADIIVTSGGASVGDHDLVRPALIAAGASLDFWKVAMRPGKPVMSGRLGQSLVLGLPGNPVSAFVTATLLLKPAIAALGGASDPMPQVQTAILGAPLPPVTARTDHIRGRFENNRVIPVGWDDSSALRGLSEAALLIVRPASSPAANIGDFVQFIALT